MFINRYSSASSSMASELGSFHGIGGGVSSPQNVLSPVGGAFAHPLTVSSSSHRYAPRTYTHAESFKRQSQSTEGAYHRREGSEGKFRGAGSNGGNGNILARRRSDFFGGRENFDGMVRRDSAELASRRDLLNFSNCNELDISDQRDLDLNDRRSGVDGGGSGGASVRNSSSSFGTTVHRDNFSEFSRRDGDAPDHYSRRGVGQSMTQYSRHGGEAVTQSSRYGGDDTDYDIDAYFPSRSNDDIEYTARRAESNYRNAIVRRSIERSSSGGGGERDISPPADSRDASFSRVVNREMSDREVEAMIRRIDAQERDVTSAMSQRNVTNAVNHRDVTNALNQRDVDNAMNHRDVTNAMNERDVASAMNYRDVTNAIGHRDVTSSMGGHATTQSVQSFR